MATNQQEHYLINMADGRRILYTKQAARQINYHPITQEVAYAIDDGRRTWQEVVARIKANLINNQDAWDDLLKKKTTMNVRKSTLTPEDTEGMETAPEGEDVADEFDMAAADKPAPEPPPAPAKKAGSRKPAGKKAVEPPPAEPAPADGEGAPVDLTPNGDDLDL